MRATFNSKDLTCSICAQFYNDSNRKAMVVCLNMHTICNSCATQNKSQECPYCKRKYNIKDIVANRYIMQQIEQQGQAFKQVNASLNDNINKSDNVLNSDQRSFENDIGGNNPYFGNNSHQVSSEMNRNQNPVVIPIVPPQQQQIYRPPNSSQQNRSNPPPIVPNNSSSWNNNARVGAQNRNRNNNNVNRNGQNRVQPIAVRANNNAKTCETIIVVMCMIFLCGLGIYLLTLGDDGTEGAIVCFVATFCGCLSLCLNQNRNNRRNQYQVIV